MIRLEILLAAGGGKRYGAQSLDFTKK